MLELLNESKRDPTKFRWAQDFYYKDDKLTMYNVLIDPKLIKSIQETIKSCNKETLETNYLNKMGEHSLLKFMVKCAIC